VLLSALLLRFARLARRIVFATGLAMAPFPVLATPPDLPGSEDPAFAQALVLWLADDEETALQDFASLAQAGNAAARIILGLIDKSPSLQGAYLAHLNRRDRIALLREPGGLSGRSWLARATDVPLVAAWGSIWDVSSGLEAIRAFRDLEEPRAAREAMVVLAAREHPNLNDLPPAEADTDLLFLLWRAADPERRAEIASLTPAAHPQRLLMGERIDPREIDIWLSSSEAAAPITALCQAVCPETGETCRGAAYRALNSHNALMTLGTPAEALVSQAEFLASPRGQSAVMRRILLATDIRGRRAMFAHLQEHSQCLAAALIAENQRYMPRLPNAPSTE
jgi:hypothetical protein